MTHQDALKIAHELRNIYHTMLWIEGAVVLFVAMTLGRLIAKATR